MIKFWQWNDVLCTRDSRSKRTALNNRRKKKYENLIRTDVLCSRVKPLNWEETKKSEKQRSKITRRQEIKEDRGLVRCVAEFRFFFCMFRQSSAESVWRLKWRKQDSREKQRSFTLKQGSRHKEMRDKWSVRTTRDSSQEENWQFSSFFIFPHIVFLLFTQHEMWFLVIFTLPVDVVEDVMTGYLDKRYWTSYDTWEDLREFSKSSRKTTRKKKLSQKLCRLQKLSSANKFILCLSQQAHLAFTSHE